MNVVALPLCSPALLQESKKPLNRPEDLVHHTLLHDETPYEGRPTWSDWLQTVGVEHVDGTRGLHFNRVSLALAAAVEAQGVVLSIEQLAADDLSKGRLVVPFHHEVQLVQAYYMISLNDSANSEPVIAFKKWLSEEATRELDW